MFRTFISRAVNSIHLRSAWRNGVLFCVLLSLCGVSAAAPPEKDDKPDVKQFCAYLPTIRCKALLDNERQYVADMERTLGLYEVYVAGGLVNQVQKGQAEAELLRGRIRVLQRDTDYRDSLDQYTLRFPVTAERRRQMEDATISPLAKLFRRYEDLSRDSAEVKYKLLQQGNAEDAAKLRPIVVKLLTTSALMKDTAVPKRFGKGGDEWRKIDSIEKARKRITKIRDNFDELRQRQTELAAKGKELPQADQQRLEEFYFTTCLGNLELKLRDYEKQSWKDIKNKIERQDARNTYFRSVVSYALAISDRGYNERLERLSRSWPALSAARLQDVDLLTCDADKAEQTVAALLKTPDGQLAGKKKVRQLRMLAKSYQIQPRLFALAFLRREIIRDAQYMPPPSAPLPLPPAGQILSISLTPPSTMDNSAFETPRVIDAHRSLSRAKQQLLQSWIDYQMVRLDLYSDLGLSPP